MTVKLHRDSAEEPAGGSPTVVVKSVESPDSAAVRRLVVIAGDEIGLRYNIVGSFTMGRGDECEIVLNDEAASREHCRIRRKRGRWYIEDLRSTNGTLVNGRSVRSSKLSHGDLITIGETVLKYLDGSDVESRYHDKLYRMSVMDELTGLYNRRFLLRSLGKAWDRAASLDEQLSLILLDIDHFKALNDAEGHVVGDKVLSAIGDRLRVGVGDAGFVGRYGGEEFAVVLPGAAIEEATELAEMLRNVVAENPFHVHGTALPVTVSAGVADRDDIEGAVTDGAPDTDMTESASLRLIQAADRRLFDAKGAGRNAVVGSRSGGD